MIRRIQIFLPFFLSFKLCMLGNFSCICCNLLMFSKLTFSKKSFRNTIGLDPDQVPHSVPLDLGPNCAHLGYQQTRKVAASKERVIETSPLYLKLYV